MTPLLAQGARVDRSFERLYQRHVGDVYRYALAVLRNPADAEDVTQTTFLNAYRAFAQGDRPQAPKNWLIAIAHNVCRQRFRQAARRPSEVELNEDIAEAFVSDDPVGVEDIQRALGHLAFNQRAALVMRELEGRSYAEIAEILEISVAAVETLIFRARRAVREQLEGTLTCGQAELAISKQVDGELSRAEKGQLRAHLRECKSCSTLARRLRAQRSAWKALGTLPLPGSLGGLFGGAGASTATGFGLVGSGAAAVKAASLVTAVVVVGGTAYEGKKLVVEKASTADTPAAAAAPKAVSIHSARPFAPGQTKAAHTRATKPAVPPGLAKKGIAETHAARVRGAAAKEHVHATGSSHASSRATAARASAPGQTRKAAPSTSTGRALKKTPRVRKRTPKPKPAHPARASKPKPAKPATAAQPTPKAPPERPETPAPPSNGGSNDGGNGNGNGGTKAAK